MPCSVGQHVKNERDAAAAKESREQDRHDAKQEARCDSWRQYAILLRRHSNPQPGDVEALAAVTKVLVRPAHVVPQDCDIVDRASAAESLVDKRESARAAVVTAREAAEEFRRTAAEQQRSLDQAVGDALADVDRADGAVFVLKRIALELPAMFDMTDDVPRLLS